jgi:hypothetical protein
METIRRKARELHRQTRRKLLGTLTVPFVVGFFCVFVSEQFPGLKRVLEPLFAFAFAWSLAGVYFLNRGNWSRVMPVDAGFSAGLEFCRREIARRRDYSRRSLLWSLGPMLLAIGAFIAALAMVAGRRIVPNAVPFISLVAVWISAYFLITRVREQRQLQREIDELNKIESNR